MARPTSPVTSAPAKAAARGSGQAPRTADVRAVSRALYAEVARVGKALSSPVRLQLIDLLRQAPRSVESLADACGVSVANASQHLLQLRRAGLVESHKEGQHVYYRIGGDRVSLFFGLLRELARERLAEMDRLLGALTDGTDFGLDEAGVVEVVRAGRATVVDVRPTSEFDEGHVAGALSMPLDELPRRAHELPRNRDVVVYCRGPLCFMSADAVRTLRREGIRAHRLDLDLPALRALRLPIERSRHAPSAARRAAAPLSPPLPKRAGASR